MTPLELSICLHYHSSCEDMPWVLGDAPCRDGTVGGLIHSGLLKLEPRKTPLGVMQFQPTARLHAFVAMLTETPLPKQAWVDPRTDKRLVGPGVSR